MMKTFFAEEVLVDISVVAFAFAIGFFALGIHRIITKPAALDGKAAEFVSEARKLTLSESAGELWFQEYARNIIEINRRMNISNSFGQWEILLYQVVENSEIAEIFGDDRTKKAVLPVLAAALAKCMVEESDGGAGYAAGVNTLIMVGAAQLLPTRDMSRELERALRYQHSDFANLYHGAPPAVKNSLLNEYRKSLSLVFKANEVEHAVHELVDHFSYSQPETV